MIQELLGGEKCIGEERKMANVNLRESGSSSSSDHHQLRCPRCDSPNTKFCYYNNYNLTQPRHFCKTCRRYWTKGGVLRNVPIGGVCRKNKTSGSSTKSTKIKSEPPKHNPVIGLDHGTVPPSMASPFLWGSPANSQLLDLQFPAVASSQHALSLALLRVSIQNPNPNSCFNPNPVLVKEEGLMIGSQQLMSEPGVLNSQTLTLDPVGGGSLWRSNNNQQQGLFAGEVESGGIQELYQRLRASANLCNSDQNSHTNTHHQALNSALDPTPLPSTELGYWNSPLSWSDLHTSNGAFP